MIILVMLTKYETNIKMYINVILLHVFHASHKSSLCIVQRYQNGLTDIYNIILI